MSSKISESLKETSDYLYSKYYPIEVSSSVPFEEKVKGMVKWWEESHESILKEKLNKSDIKEMVKETRMHFRDKFHDLIDLLNEKKLPLLIFSAGLFDVIKEILELENIFVSSISSGDESIISIISNEMIFDDTTQQIIGFKQPLIHVFNKNETNVKNNSHFSSIKNRSNVIVMGDSTGDLKMSQGLEHKVTLSIGFLNHDTQEHIETYMDLFDIVIINDSSFELVCKLIQLVKATK